MNERSLPSSLALRGLSVVVVAHDEEAKIGACMRSIAEQDLEGAGLEDVEVILVDDGSTDRTVEVARAACPSVRVISNPSRSISSNRNRGLRAARHRWVAFLDADCEAPRHWLRALASAAREASPGGRRLAAVGGGNAPPAGETRFYDALARLLDSWIGSRGSVQGRLYTEPREVGHLPGLNVLYDREAVETAGGWDERFRLIGEDEDLSRRLADQGFRLRYVPGAAVVHRQRGDWRSWTHNMFTYGKGRTWLVRRHPRLLEPALLLPPLLPLFLWLHVPAMLAVALFLAARRRDGRRRLDLVFHLWTLLVLTHTAYGLGQWYGLATPGDSEKAREPRRPKLGLLALKNAGNLGDEAIVISVCRRLDRDPPPVDRYLLALGPSGFDVRWLPPGEGAERVVKTALGASDEARVPTPWRPAAWAQGLRLLAVLAGFRAVLISGGQWLHDLKPAYHWIVTSIFALARAFGTRVGFFTIGMGPLRSKVSRRAVRWAFGRRALAVVRDRRSLALCREIGFAEPVLGVDPVLEMEPRSPIGDASPEPRRDASPPDGPVVGLSPCAWTRFEDLYRQDESAEERLVEDLRFLVAGVAARGGRTRVIPTMNPEDRRLAERLRENLDDDPELAATLEIVATEALSPARAAGEIARLDALVSMRLHPAIFATDAGVPFLALRYAEKVAELCADLDAEDLLVELDRGDGAPTWPEVVIERLDRLLADPESVRRRLEAGRRRLVAERLDPAYAALGAWLARVGAA